MTAVIFGVGVFVFFITVYGIVVAGGLQLSAYQVREQPGPEGDADFAEQHVAREVPESDANSPEV